MAIICGNADEAVSPHLKVWIKQGNVWVVGLIGPGTSRQMQANWNSPFEQSNVGSMFEKTAGLAQVVTGKTTITTLSSTQVWEGNRPHSFNLVLIFYALRDAWREVMQPLISLEEMMAPEVSAGEQKEIGTTWESVKIATSELLASVKPGGGIPLPVMLNIGRRSIIDNCVIENMQAPLDKERTKEGYLVRAEVTLSIATKTMLNKASIRATWGAN